MIGSPARWAALAVVLLVGAAHANTLAGKFVYDDHRFIEHNESIRSVPWLGAFTDPATASHGQGIRHDIYRPLRTLLFACEFQLFAHVEGDGRVEYRLPWWHLVSILLHALNSVLILRLLLPLLRGALLPAAAGALIFGLHPVTSESVAWLSSQGDLLAMTLFLTALLVLERPERGRTVAGVVLFLLACLAKESALMLPALLPLRDAALPRGAVTPWRRETWIRVGLLAGVAALYFALRAAVLPGLAQVDHPYGDPLATVRGMLHGLAWYAQVLLWPLGFSFDTRLDVPLRWTDPEVWVGLGVLGSLLAAGVFGLRRRRSTMAFAALGFLICLAPVSNIVVPLKTFVAERFLYPALLCVAAAAAGLLLSLRGSARTAALTVGVFLLGALCMLTVQRNAAWASDGTLWEAVRADRPWNANAYQGLAYEFVARKRVVDAENAFSTYLQSNPADGKAMYAMGNLFGELAQSLVEAGPAPIPGETNIDLRRRQARVAQIRLYQRAMEVWSQPGGLTLGRGSPDMLADMLNRWIDAATSLGDLSAARYANDAAIDVEAKGAYTHDDFSAVWERASWLRRRTRLELALRAVRRSQAPAALRESVAATRALVLRDVGLDPAAGDAAQRRPLIERLRALMREALASVELQADPGVFADLALLLLADGDPEQARAVVADGRRLYPKEPLLEVVEEQVEAALGRPR